MAEGFAKIIGQDVVMAYSAGSRPSGEVNPIAIEVMKEAGIDISGAVSKGFDDLPTKDFNFAVTLGCKDSCPFVAAEKHIQWEIEDPKGKGIEVFRETRDTLKKEVQALLEKIKKGGLR